VTGNGSDQLSCIWPSSDQESSVDSINRNEKCIASFSGRGLRSNAVLCSEDRTTEILVLGEKGKSQLQRDMKQYFVGTVNDTGRARITFAMVCSPSSMTSLTRKRCHISN
jgi:hypothetical protein